MAKVNVTIECAALTKMLQVTMLDAAAFNKAVELGYIVVRAEGTLGWTLESVTLLAYFCGRLWCGDQGVYSKRKKAMLWVMGKGVFPAIALNKLFGVKSLKKSRQNRIGRTLPEHHEIIDALF